ncbi:Guanylate-binding protein 2, partial [Dissostichus eleginoides]
MCQHNKARVVASSRHDKVGDIECLAPDPSGGDGPSGEQRQKTEAEEMERHESSRKKVMAERIERESNDEHGGIKDILMARLWEKERGGSQGGKDKTERVQSSEADDCVFLAGLISHDSAGVQRNDECICSSAQETSSILVSSVAGGAAVGT